MNIVDTKTLSIKEGIELCIKNGLPGAEAQLVSFTKNKKLATNQKVKLQGNLESLFYEVLITGGGQSGKCILNGEKENPTERITGNSANGKKPTEEDEILKEYFFAELVRRIGHREEGWSETYNLWGRDWINQLSISDMEWANFETELKKTFSNIEKLNENAIKDIFNNIKENLKKNTRALAIKSIERLEKENRIKTEIEFFQAIAKGSYVEAMLKEGIEEGEIVDYHNEISEKMQMRIAAEIGERLVPFEMSYKRYKVVSAFPQFGTPEEKEALRAIGEWLIDEYSVDYLYNRIRIYVIDPSSKKDISKKEAETTFVNRIINKANQRMNRKDYKTTHKFQNAFYRLSMFMLLDIKKIEGLKETILSEKKNLNQVSSECVFQYALKYGEKYEAPKEERTVFGFGEVSLEDKKKEIPEALKDVDITKLFDEVKPVEIKNKELEWMNRFPANPKKRKEVTKTKPSVYVKPTITGNMIDIEAIKNEIEPVKVEKQYNRIFGSTFVIRNENKIKEFVANE
ncbi:hypothetical protein [Planococcus halocryophilus]|uniref:hypothetical protein n=1 Tax=Planococcus halocryophilus TaxID=1215089 RepID=UPI001F0DA756|nr:hypothetical protein [Planococcus halocryophilus]MCH4825758.1 hypothetical protein [Planococcus halocryophilus]